MKQQLLLCRAFVLGVVLGVPVYSFAQVSTPAPAEPAAPPADATPGHFAEERHSSTAEVVAVDAAKRMITLREEGEEPQSFEVSDEVRNLDQVKAGDRVKVDTHASSSIKVLPPGDIGETASATIERSEPGEKPGGVAARTKTITVTVSSVFPESKEFLTRNAQGKLRTWKVKDAKELENLKSGDRVQLTLTSSVAVSVTPAPPKDASAPAAASPDAAAAPGAAPAPAATPAPAPAPAPAPKD